MTKRNPEVDFYFSKSIQWGKQIIYLRKIVLDCGLTEVLKWGCPCYTFQNNNIVLIHVFKEYCALLFFKGVLLKDPYNMLIRQTPNVQAARQIRFNSGADIAELEPFLKEYIHQAIEVAQAGLKVNMRKASEFPVAEEFQVALNQSPGLKTAFESLTPGRQRAYLLYFSSAKQAKTRRARVEKYIPYILNEKGLDD